ncbi:MAG TPA: alpha/beta fold hydrolase [Solirubrobacteraceae bacterium]|nr:alpha/beta fold hydrolase [Solirubrobacteraceae bacterium]
MPATCPPSAFEEIVFTDSITAWAAAAEGTAAWWAGALRSGATPVDVLTDATKWWHAVSERGLPSWSTPHTIAFEASVARLRDFSTEPEAMIVPTLVLPPQAGHDSCIVDYTSDQSQMATIIEAGLTRAFTLDWIGATPETRDLGIDDYLDVIARAVDYAGGRVNLVGDCQGGWLATIYAALHPEQVNTLTIAGAPIDFHSGEPVIHSALTWFAPGGDLSFYRALVAANGGVLPGESLLAGFIIIKPDNEVGRQVQLLANINDEAYVARYREFEDWFKHTQAIPGAFYLWIVEHLFRDNELIAGTLEVGGKHVNLAQISAPLFLLAGAADHITPPAQVFALADYAGTPASQVMRETAAGGHLGLFMGHEALTNHWPALMRSVYERSV